MRNDDLTLLHGLFPAVVVEYDQEARACRVEVPGITDGADPMPLAEIKYPVGHKSSHENYATEIEILPGDACWVSFMGGDDRYPIIEGYRNPNVGNSADWRRAHHANIEQIADKVLRLRTDDNKTVVTIDHENGVTINTELDLVAVVKGQIAAAADGDVTVTSKSNATVEAKGEIIAKAGGNMSLEGAVVSVNGGVVGVQGVVRQCDLCALTGAGHMMASSTVVAGD